MRRLSRAALATALLLSGLVLGQPRLAFAQRAPIPRESLEALEASLDRAVGQVSRPAPGIVLGRAESARGYHLPGYGAVFVLAPRALPRGDAVFALRPRKAPAGRSRPQFEARVERDGSSEERAARLPAREQRVASPESDELLAIEQQVLEFQREAEETRQSAELEFERLTRDLHDRLAVPPASQRLPRHRSLRGRERPRSAPRRRPRSSRSRPPRRAPCHPRRGASGSRRTGRPTTAPRMRSWPTSGRR